MAFSAQGAVDSLLGRLSSVLVDEAQLLGSVRGEIRFINDEMETMNGLLMHLGEVPDHNHLVRAWMKQVRDLAFDSQNCVDHYVRCLGTGHHHRGLLARMRRLPLFLWTVPARRRIATRIRELKVRVSEVSERRLRYDIRVPDAPPKQQPTMSAPNDGEGLQDDNRRRALFDAEADWSRAGVDAVMQWLTEQTGDGEDGRRLCTDAVIELQVEQSKDEEEGQSGMDDEIELQAEQPRRAEQRRRVKICIAGYDGPGEDPIARTVYNYSSMARSFDCKAWITLGKDPPDTTQVLQDILHQVLPPDMWRTVSYKKIELGKKHLALGLKWRFNEWLIRLLGLKERSEGRLIRLLGLKVEKMIKWQLTEEVRWHLQCHSMLDFQHGPIFRQHNSCFIDGLERLLEEDNIERLKEGLERHLEEQRTWIFKKLLKWYLAGKSYLIVLDDVWDESVWSYIESVLPYADGSVVLATRMSEVPEICSPYRIFNRNHDDLTNFFVNRAYTLLSNNRNKDNLLEAIGLIVSHCAADVFAMKLFLHVLYANPYRTKEELEKLAKDLYGCKGKAAEQMLSLCYNELPSHYKSSLLYLTIFPQGSKIRRTSLVRLWVVDGLISTRSGQSALDEADCCFNALADWGFIYPVDMCSAGKIKACIIHHSVFHFITWVARYENFMDMDTVLDKDLRLSIRNGKDGIEMLLQSLSTSSRLRLLKVLDLEGCIGLKKHHVKKICNMILLLKYLSLRNTDVTCLPKQIDKLQHLETLDIRQTEIRAFPRRAVLLALKHLFAGNIECPPSKDAIWSKDLSSTMHIPLGIGIMRQIQVLSHVKVSDNAQELKDIGWLLQLKKLGVVLQCKEADLKHLLRVVDRLNRCLRSLSIWVGLPGTVKRYSLDMNPVGIVFSPPKFLESLSIRGIRSGLPLWIEQLHQLIKITLRETNLTEKDLFILGKLPRLRCLRLRYQSYVIDTLTFRENEFQNLKFLIVEGSDIANIKFEPGATPKLEKLVWSFLLMESLSLIGTRHLPRLKEVELNGKGNADQVKQSIERHPNHPLFKHNP